MMDNNKFLEKVLSKNEGIKCLQCGYGVISKDPIKSQQLHHIEWENHNFDIKKSERTYWLTDTNLLKINKEASNQTATQIFAELDKLHLPNACEYCEGCNLKEDDNYLAFKSKFGIK